MGEARQRFVVTGAHEQTGEPFAATVEAPSAAAAEGHVRKRGILVSEVKPEALAYAAPSETFTAAGTHIESVSFGAAFKLGLVGFLGFVCGGIVLSAVLAMLNFILGGIIWSALR